MNDWIVVIGMGWMVMLLMIMGLPSLLLWRDERRQQAQKDRTKNRVGAAASSD